VFLQIFHTTLFVATPMEPLIELFSVFVFNHKALKSHDPHFWPIQAKFPPGTTLKL